MQIVTCLNCGNKQELRSYKSDKLGHHTTCNKCNSTFDIDSEREYKLTERCLTFKYAGDNKQENCIKLSKLLDENNIDYACYDSNSNYWYATFIVRRCNNKWNDIIRLINSIKAAKYNYIKTTFYITNINKNNNLGNMQEIIVC